MKHFNSTAFYNGFNITIKALKESERITKDALRSLSRECLMLVHYESKNQGDISPINQVASVLTPINKKTWILFMQEFTGFHYDEKLGEFTKKDKKAYDNKSAKAIEMLDDGHFNLWSWAELNVKVEKKVFKLDTLGKDVKRALEEEDAEGNAMYSKADVIKTIMENGISADDLIELLQAMDIVDVA